ncbi:hypothetical protein ONZ45_g7808 [Pleurotus djamor]|nr:hypothetical protein ONZ45_g7808 [Pleurotus djamor]
MSSSSPSRKDKPKSKEVFEPGSPLEPTPTPTARFALESLSSLSFFRAPPKHDSNTSEDADVAASTGGGGNGSGGSGAKSSHGSWRPSTIVSGGGASTKSASSSTATKYADEASSEIAAKKPQSSSKVSSTIAGASGGDEMEVDAPTQKSKDAAGSKGNSVSSKSASTSATTQSPGGSVNATTKGTKDDATTGLKEGSAAGNSKPPPTAAATSLRTDIQYIPGTNVLALSPSFSRLSGPGIIPAPSVLPLSLTTSKPTSANTTCLDSPQTKPKKARKRAKVKEPKDAARRASVSSVETASPSPTTVSMTSAAMGIEASAPETTGTSPSGVPRKSALDTLAKGQGLPPAKKRRISPPSTSVASSASLPAVVSSSQPLDSSSTKSSSSGAPSNTTTSASLPTAPVVPAVDPSATLGTFAAQNDGSSVVGARAAKAKTDNVIDNQNDNRVNALIPVSTLTASSSTSPGLHEQRSMPPTSAEERTTKQHPTPAYPPTTAPVPKNSVATSAPSTATSTPAPTSAPTRSNPTIPPSTPSTTSVATPSSSTPSTSVPPRSTASRPFLHLRTHATAPTSTPTAWSSNPQSQTSASTSTTSSAAASSSTPSNPPSSSTDPPKENQYESTKQLQALITENATLKRNLSAIKVAFKREKEGHDREGAKVLEMLLGLVEVLSRLSASESSSNDATDKGKGSSTTITTKSASSTTTTTPQSSNATRSSTGTTTSSSISLPPWQAIATQFGALKGAIERLVTQDDDIKRESETLRTENGEVRKENDKVRVERKRVEEYEEWQKGKPERERKEEEAKSEVLQLRGQVRDVNAKMKLVVTERDKLKVTHQQHLDKCTERDRVQAQRIISLAKEKDELVAWKDAAMRKQRKDENERIAQEEERKKREKEREQDEKERERRESEKTKEDAKRWMLAEEKHANIRKEKDGLEIELKATNLKLSNLKTEYEACAARYATAVSEFEAFKVDVAKIAATATANKNTFSDAHTQTDVVEPDQEAASRSSSIPPPPSSSSSTPTPTDVASLTTQLTELKERYNNVMSAWIRTRASLSSESKRLQVMMKERDEAFTVAERMKKEADLVKREVVEIKDRLEVEQSAKMNEKERMQKEVDQVEERCRVLVAGKEELENMLEQAKKRAEDADEKMRKLEEENEEVKAMYEEAKEQLAMASKDVEMLSSEKNAMEWLENQRDELEKTLETANKKLEEADADKVELKGMYSAAKKEVGDLEHELSIVKAKLKKLSEEARSQVNKCLRCEEASNGERIPARVEIAPAPSPLPPPPPPILPSPALASDISKLLLSEISSWSKVSSLLNDASTLNISLLRTSVGHPPHPHYNPYDLDSDHDVDDELSTSFQSILRQIHAIHAVMVSLCGDRQAYLFGMTGTLAPLFQSSLDMGIFSGKSLLAEFEFNVSKAVKVTSPGTQRRPGASASVPEANGIGKNHSVQSSRRSLHPTASSSSIPTSSSARASASTSTVSKENGKAKATSAADIPDALSDVLANLVAQVDEITTPSGNILKFLYSDSTPPTRDHSFTSTLSSTSALPSALSRAHSRDGQSHRGGGSGNGIHVRFSNNPEIVAIDSRAPTPILDDDDEGTAAGPSQHTKRKRRESDDGSLEADLGGQPEREGAATNGRGRGSKKGHTHTGKTRRRKRISFGF